MSVDNEYTRLIAQQQIASMRFSLDVIFALGPLTSQQALALLVSSCRKK
jgi:hypothetical protein